MDLSCSFNNLFLVKKIPDKELILFLFQQLSHCQREPGEARAHALQG